MILPTEIIVAEKGNPKSILLYGPPKVGKTSLLAELSKLHNFLLIDLEEEGSDEVDAVKIKIKNLDELQLLGEEIMKAGRPYNGIIIDNASELEDWCEISATEAYMNSPMGANFNRYKISDGKGKDAVGKIKPRSEWDSVLTLPRGSGYNWLRIEFKKWLTKLMKLADYIVVVAHLKDIYLEEKSGSDIDPQDIDLVGKLKRIACGKLSTVAYVYRDPKKPEELRMSFKSPAANVLAGSRSQHLRNQDIVIAINNPDGSFKEVHWDKVYTNGINKEKTI